MEIVVREVDEIPFVVKVVGGKHSQKIEDVVSRFKSASDLTRARREASPYRLIQENVRCLE